jgi:Capsule polysaccharide biosynthesis protein
MKILVYLEPHPIRNRFESFGFIGKRFITMLRDEYLGHRNSGSEPVEVRMLLSRHYSPLRDANKDMAPMFLSMTQEENDAITARMRDWNNDPESVNQWVQLMKGEGEVSALYESILRRVHDDVFPFDVVVNWSTNGAVRRFCESRGLDAVSMEMGCTRPPVYDSAYVDAMGVNGSAISRHVDLSCVRPLDPDLLRAMLPTRCGGGQAWDAAHNLIVSRHARDIYRDVDRNVLIPLQLKDDSNCILFSDYGSMLELLQDVLPKLRAAGYRVFVKPHPAARDRAMNKADHEACAALVAEIDDGVYWLDDIRQQEDYLALLQKMHAVVTINSSTGFEAMVCGRLVIPLGEAPYKIGADFPTLTDLLESRIDQDRYRDMAQRVTSIMLRNYLVPHQLAFDFPHFVRHLRRAIRTRDLLSLEGAKAMTEYMQTEDLLDFSVREALTAQRQLHARFAAAQTAAEAAKKPKPVPLKVVAKPVAPVEKVPTAQGTPDVFSRKLRKLRRDPARFLVDSSNPLLKQMGILLGGRA